MIIVRLDWVLADRKMQLNELHCKFIQFKNWKSKGHSLLHIKLHLQNFKLSTWRYFGICGG